MGYTDVGNYFKATGVVKKIKYGKSQKNDEGYLFVNICCDIPGETYDELRVNAVIFERIGQELWLVAQSLGVNDKVEIEGYFHNRKQTNNTFKNSNGQPFVSWGHQLVIQKVVVL